MITLFLYGIIYIMPTIPNYKLDNDDLNAMDYLLSVKNKMLNKMKIEDEEIKYDGLKNIDTSLIKSNFDGAEKLLKSIDETFKQINNRLLIPQPKTGAPGAPPSSVVSNINNNVIQIFDYLTKINDDTDLLYNIVYDLLPFTKYIDNKKIKKIINDTKKIIDDIVQLYNTKIGTLRAPLLVLTGSTFTVNEVVGRFGETKQNISKLTRLINDFNRLNRSQQKIPIK